MSQAGPHSGNGASGILNSQLFDPEPILSIGLSNLDRRSARMLNLHGM